MSLARPPERQASGPLALIGRFLLTVIFLAIVGAIGWAVVTNQSIESAESLDRDVVAPGTIVIIPGLTEVHLRSEGTGDPVLFLHDFDLAGGYQWTKTAELLTDHRLLMPDLVDFGFSARPSSRGRLHTVVGQAETMLAMLEELGITNLSVVGAGLGGSVAAQMASIEPGVVDRLILISPEILGPEPSWQSILYRLPSVGDAMTFTFLGAGESGRLDVFGRLRKRWVLPGRRGPRGSDGRGHGARYHQRAHCDVCHSSGFDPARLLGHDHGPNPDPVGRRRHDHSR